MKKYPYLTTISATLLSLIEGVFALLSLAFLFRFVFSLGILLGTVIKAFLASRPELVMDQLSVYLYKIAEAYTLDPQFINDTLSSIEASVGFGLLQAGIAAALSFLLMLLFPILTILNGYGAISLRMRKKGCGMIKAVHIIYAMFNLIGIAIVIFLNTQFFYFNKDLLYTLLDLSTAQTLSLVAHVMVILSSVITILILFMIFCYHKDIVQTMTFVSSQIKEKETPFRKNHFSFLAILGCLFYLILFVIVMILTPQFQLQQVLLLVFLGANMFRYLFASLANRGLTLFETTKVKQS